MSEEKLKIKGHQRKKHQEKMETLDELKEHQALVEITLKLFVCRAFISRLEFLVNEFG